MNMALKVDAEMPATFKERKEALKDDRGMCAVIAVSAITGLSPTEAQALLAKHGRKHRCGTPRQVTKKALESLGYKVNTHGRSWIRKNIIANYPGRHTGLLSATTHHPRRFPGAWAKVGDCLMFSRSHVSAFVKGQVDDWAIKHSKQINDLWFIEKPELAPMNAWPALPEDEQ
jgi:hypothetical protein